ncbi:MAG: DMT family transporter [Halomonadaceae bacterium]|nr:MAG: DMT family transporter [Halomonadaceae bacterium]
MGALIKYLSPDLGNSMIVFGRNLLGLGILLPILLIREGPRYLITPHLRFHLMRGVIGVSAMYCYFFSLGKLPLTDAVLLKLTAPFFIPLIAFFWLGERTAMVTVIAIALGFCGVMVLLQPGQASVEDLFFVLAGVSGAVLGATAKVTIRRMGVSEPSPRIVLYFALIASAVSAPAALLNWQWPTALQWLLLLAMAATATAAQLLITTAYRIAPAGAIGQFTYSSVLFAVLLGWLFFAEPLSLNQALGGALIVFAGLLNMRARG